MRGFDASKTQSRGGSHAGTEIGVATDKFIIGRSENCNLRPKSESVSRQHCILVIKDGKLLVQDLKSRNGTYVNEKLLPSDKAKVLASGDMLRVGKLDFEVVIEHGLQAPKKPEVTSVSDAAARTVASGDGSKFEAIDVNSWLEEADQIDRVVVWQILIRASSALIQRNRLQMTPRATPILKSPRVMTRR